MLKRISVILILMIFALSLPALAAIKVKKEYYPSGELKAEIPYVKGKMDGLKKVYNKDGKLIEEHYYKKGKLIEVTILDNLDFGPLNFVKSWVFWASLVSGLLLIWFLISKVLLSNKPF